MTLLSGKAASLKERGEGKVHRRAIPQITEKRKSAGTLAKNSSLDSAHREHGRGVEKTKLAYYKKEGRGFRLDVKSR